ncbi:isopenicillin N synthase family oxygenase [Rhodococcus sp. GA1]|uniref:isopenicillin N synthase family dioxygenase n=1 Tax=Rhodococcus sp. GA1 TaxID=2942275 RepID=UPI0020CF2E2F|nr:2-oxoglutarate and iron-dependent oxygenase domain-containing protein [Rhodococcus sp. GA1]
MPPTTTDHTATSATFEVPAVDITAYVAGGTTEARAETARQLDDACKKVGFIQILGHGIPQEILDGLQDAHDAFFGLPLAEKKQSLADGNRGYTAPKSESLSLSLGIENANRMNDFFEAFNIGSESSWYPALNLSAQDYTANTWPDVDGFEPQVMAYYHEAARVARTLTTIFADALDLPSDYFEYLCDHSIDVLRMVNYALPEGTVRLDGDLKGMGEHTDFGIVTVLWADQVEGLQVLGTDGVWHDVQPSDGALLVNLGDLTARLTNDRWMSTLHRVAPPVVDGVIKRRRSVAFFHDGNADAVIATLPSHLDADNGLAYEPITVREHVKAKLEGSQKGKANSAAVREAARVLAAQGQQR